ELCYDNVARICRRAEELDNFVRIDMESTAYTDRTLGVFRKRWNEGGFRNVGVVLHAYLYRTEQDVREMNALGARVRLCKGGYNMPVYVPYGHEWYPYFMRRLAERPANVVFVMGNLLRR